MEDWIYNSTLADDKRTCSKTGIAHHLALFLRDKTNTYEKRNSKKE